MSSFITGFVEIFSMRYCEGTEYSNMSLLLTHSLTILLSHRLPYLKRYTKLRVRTSYEHQVHVIMLLHQNQTKTNDSNGTFNTTALTDGVERQLKSMALSANCWSRVFARNP